MIATIESTHVLCAIGSGSDQVWAAARAGIARIGNSHVMDRHFDPIRMGLVPEAALGALTPEIDAMPLPARARRMLRLAAPSLQAAAGGLTTPVPLFLGLPELVPAQTPWLVHVPTYLRKMTGVPIDPARSLTLPMGRAAALIALERALQQLVSGEIETAVIGGVDTYLDLRLLSELDGEGRILGPRVMDGFVPGEGAAFYVLSSTRSRRAATVPRVVVNGAGSAMDPGHRYGDAPAKGEGLALALAQLRQRMPPTPAIAATFAGLNGENFEAKLWGVARMRHGDFFSPSMVMDHPADKYGDAGAATGAMLVALAAESLRGGTRTGPALVWAASDREPRACAVVSAVPN